MSGKIFKLQLEVPRESLGSVLKEFITGEGKTNYPMTIEVPESDLGQIIVKLAQGGIKLIGATATGKLDIDNRTPAGSRFVGGQRNKGITGKQLVMQLLTNEQRVWRGDQITSAFKKHNFAGGSWSAPMGELVREQKVRALGSGKYVLPGVTIHPGD